MFSVGVLLVARPAEAKVFEVEADPVVVVEPHHPAVRSAARQHSARSARVQSDPVLVSSNKLTPRAAVKVVPHPHREAAMLKEFDCIRDHVGKNQDLDWAEVCASQGTGWEMETAPWNSASSKSTQTAAAETGDFIGSAKDRDILERSRKAINTSSENYLHDMAESDGRQMKEPTNFEATFDFLMGRRRDNLSWNIAGNIDGSTPNVLSELTWGDLDTIIGKGKSQLVFLDKFVFDGYMAYGDIYEGDNQDSDYAGDNRTLEFSRSNNNGGGGNVLDMVGGLGYRIQVSDPDTKNLFFVDSLYVTPLAGYSHHEQNLRITDGYQTIPNLGSFNNFGVHLSSSYEAEWNGPWAGFELKGSKKKWTGAFRYEWHWADYTAEANWNLRNEFQHPKSFEHIADGTGMVLGFDGGYQLTDFLSFSFNVDYQDWHTDAGIDRVFLSSGATSETQLNEVTWDSLSIMGGFTYHFGR